MTTTRKRPGNQASERMIESIRNESKKNKFAKLTEFLRISQINRDVTKINKQSFNRTKPKPSVTFVAAKQCGIATEAPQSTN